MKNKIVYTTITITALLLAIQLPAQQQRQRQTVKNNPTRQPTAMKTVVDTANMPKYVTKDVVFEVPAEKGSTIHIVNNNCNLDIRSWTESKVKIATTVSVDEKLANMTVEMLMEHGGLSVKSFGNRVNIESKYTLQLSKYYIDGNPLFNKLTTSGQYLFPNEHPTVNHTEPTTAETELREILASQETANIRKEIYHSIISSNNSKVMTIYIPEGARLDVDNKGTNIIINTNIGNASFKMSRTNLDARDFNRLTVVGDYSTLNISDATDAEIELENGTLTARIIGNLDLDCTNSEIEYEGGEYCYLRSQSDRITIDEIGKIDGRKLYGDLRIGKLKNSIDIEGANADIKIRHLLPEVDKIKINNKYADLRLPVKQLSNYTVTFFGANSTVFASFEKVPVLETLKLQPVDGTKNNKTDAEKKLSTTMLEQGVDVRKVYTMVDGEPVYFPSTRTFGEIAPVKFTASVGATTGKYTKFDIVCHQCSVDFK
jgi:hypothetical protein